MVNEVVKHGAELNTIPLRRFTPTEMNLFFAIVSRMQDKGDKVVRFSFAQLKELSDYKPTANRRFIDDIETTYQKLLHLTFSRISKSGLNREMFVMFTRFKIVGESEEPYVDVQLHEMAIPLLNNLEQWVRYSLTEFRELQSGYSKTMFRLLKQFRTTGYAKFKKEDFFELLDIPKSYWNKQANVDSKVLKPIREELTPIFRALKIKKEHSKKRGRPIVAYIFTWKPEMKTANDFNKGKKYPKNIEQKKFNIEHTDELTQEEKYRAIDRINGLPLGTTKQKSEEPEKLDVDALLAKLHNE
ncbi:Truncated RepA [Tetragenococcus halophilus subsp. halophilus]|uniref:replication initiation protein n=1 Tax=Tetragenococcus halophilus TaxID=51669 RepID=UPI000CC7B7DB|nr:replication initiation protein [Tetragenococcus halophilus]GBD81164.1 Truncated RepA [Tetragenococcus halophilus subsp. halophilus]